MVDVLELKSYQYYTFSSRNSGSKGIITCKTKEGKTVNVHFLEGPGSLPPARKLNENQFMIYYSYSDMPFIVDMLRNESPVYMIHVPEGNNNTRLSTDSEAVGEGEEK